MNDKNMEDSKWLNAKCEICGKEYHLKPYRIKRAQHLYCSIECRAEAQKQLMRGSGNHQFGLRGDKNSTWKGGTMISNYGYRYVQQIGHPFARKRMQYVFEHRLVAEKYLLTDENSVEIDGKRYLSPEYVVHHKNGNRLDNRVENLEVMTKQEHQSLHNIERLNQCERDEKGRFVTFGRESF